MAIDDVEDITPRVQYSAAALQTVFDYPFPIFEDEDLVVNVNGTDLVLDTDYTVSGAGTDNGGDVTLSVGLIANDVVTIYRDISIERTTNFQQNGPWTSSAINTELDRITMVQQQLETQIGRAIRFPVIGPSSAAQNELSPISNWFGKFLRVSTAGILEAADIASNLVALTQSVIGLLLNPRTAGEVAAGVTPVNYWFKPLHAERYQTNSTPGTTVMSNGFQAAFDVAKKTGGVVTWDEGPYVLDRDMDLTNPIGSQNCMFAVIPRGRFKAPTNSVGTTATPSIILKHVNAGGNAFDTTGSQGIHFENLSIASADNSTYPATCFLRARNSDGASRTDRLINCYVYGPFSKTIDANYGSEDDVLDGCQFYNTATNANATAFDISGFNNFRGFSSAFTTIATGSQSCLDHKIFGGEFANFGGQSTSYVARFDGARSVKIFGPWMDSSTANGGASGRALIFVDGTNAGSGPVTLIGIDGEANNNTANFGILFDGSSTTHPNWVVIGNIFPNTGSMLGGGGAGTTISQLTWLNNTNSSTGGGVSFNGTIDSPIADNTPGGFAANAITNPFTIPMNAVFTHASESNISLVDTSQASGSRWMKLRQVAGAFTVSNCDNVGSPTANQFSSTSAQFTTGADFKVTGKAGFSNTAPISKPTVTGAKGSNAALTSLLTALASYGLITDSSTA